MSLFQIGRLAVKLAGRDAGRKCVIVELIDHNFAVVDGDVRRKKVNLKHLEPLTDIVEVKEKASPDEVKKAFEKLGLSVWEKKSKTPTERVRKMKKVKAKVSTEKKTKKETIKTKEVPKTAEKLVEAKAEDKTKEKNN